MKTIRTRAIVLRRTNYGEADRILQLLTPLGRIAAIARGVRREKSKLAGGIELFAVSDIVVGEGKGQLKIITSSRLIQFYRHILEDYDRLQFAYETLAQVSKASESLDEPEWYDIVQEVLIGLDNKLLPLQLTQLWFYLHVSTVLGDQLNTERDTKGEKLLSDEVYKYDSAEKGFYVAKEGGIAADHIKILRLTQVKSLATMAQIGGIQPYLADCLYVAREHASL